MNQMSHAQVTADIAAIAAQIGKNSLSGDDGAPTILAW